MSLPLFPTTDAERKAIPIWTYITQYVPRALIAATRVSVKGNIQHNPERSPTDIVWARGKSMDQLNTAARHLMDHSSGTIYDTDGELHLAKAYWRIGAELELLCERLEAEKTADSAPAVCPKCSGTGKEPVNGGTGWYRCPCGAADSASVTQETKNA